MKLVFALSVLVSNVGVFLCGLGQWKTRPGILLAGHVLVAAPLFFLQFAKVRVTSKTGIGSPYLFRVDGATTSPFVRRVLAYVVLWMIGSVVASSVAGVVADILGLDGFVFAGIFLLLALGVNNAFLYQLDRHLDWELMMDDGSAAIDRALYVPMSSSFDLVQPRFVSIDRYRLGKAQAEAWYAMHDAALSARYPSKYVAVGENGVLAVGVTRSEADSKILAMIALQRKQNPTGPEHLPCTIRNPSRTRLNTCHVRSVN